MGRGLAFGDLDNDGDIDLLVSNSGLPINLLLNDRQGSSHWLGVALTHDKGEAAVLGARVIVEAAGRRLVRTARTAYSYAGTNDPRVHFGLGSQARPVTLTVLWPDGHRTRVTDVPVDRYVTLNPKGIVEGPAGRRVLHWQQHSALPARDRQRV